MITYKNVVNPPSSKKISSLYDYIKLLEEKYGREFTLGNLNTEITNYGMNIGIKPNGNIYIYGADYKNFGNINGTKIDIESIFDAVDKDVFLKKLHTIPMTKILLLLSEHENVKHMVDEINNPYWVIKSLYRKDKTLLIQTVLNYNI